MVLIAASVCLGWGSSWDEIKSAAAGVRSLNADFTQEKQMKILLKPLISTGTLHYQAPGSLRWEYRAPVKNILLMHDKSIVRLINTANGWRKDAGARLPGMQVVLQQIVSWLSGKFDESPLFSAALVPGVKIVLTPRQEAVARMIQRVELHLSPIAGILDAVIIYESDDSLTKLVFTNPVLNQPISPSVFKEIQ